MAHSRCLGEHSYRFSCRQSGERCPHGADRNTISWSRNRAEAVEKPAEQAIGLEQIFDTEKPHRCTDRRSNRGWIEMGVVVYGQHKRRRRQYRLPFDSQ